ncbi:hypothetical protein HDV01_006101 [Terramyces sp. JEL0728]|nr:hypothetical protein HDV01_006101 [Terramyces sp. JEL0728]
MATLRELLADLDKQDKEIKKRHQYSILDQVSSEDDSGEDESDYSDDSGPVLGETPVQVYCFLCKRKYAVTDFSNKQLECPKDMRYCLRHTQGKVLAPEPMFDEKEANSAGENYEELSDFVVQGDEVEYASDSDSKLRKIKQTRKTPNSKRKRFQIGDGDSSSSEHPSSARKLLRKKDALQKHQQSSSPVTKKEKLLKLAEKAKRKNKRIISDDSESASESLSDFDDPPPRHTKKVATPKPKPKSKTTTRVIDSDSDHAIPTKKSVKPAPKNISRKIPINSRNPGSASTTPVQKQTSRLQKYLKKPQILLSDSDHEPPINRNPPRKKRSPIKEHKSEYHRMLENAFAKNPSKDVYSSTGLVYSDEDY